MLLETGPAVKPKTSSLLLPRYDDSRKEKLDHAPVSANLAPVLFHSPFPILRKRWSLRPRK